TRWPCASSIARSAAKTASSPPGSRYRQCTSSTAGRASRPALFIHTGRRGLVDKVEFVPEDEGIDAPDLGHVFGAAGLVVVEQAQDRLGVKEALGHRAREFLPHHRVVFILPQPVVERHREAELAPLGNAFGQLAQRGGEQGNL